MPTLSRFTITNTAVVTAPTSVAAGSALTCTVKDLSRIFIRMTNTSSTTTVVATVSASDDPMVAEGIGTQAFNIAPDGTVYWGVPDSARFKSTAGTIVITPDATADGVTYEIGELTPY